MRGELYSMLVVRASPVVDLARCQPGTN